MDNKRAIIIAISGVLIYISYTKIFSILTALFSWFNVIFKIENVYLQISLYIVIGSISLFIMIYTYNQILKKKKVTLNSVYFLIILNVSLYILLYVIMQFYNNYLANNQTSTSNYRISHLMNISTYQTLLSLIIPIFGLFYFIKKAKN